MNREVLFVRSGSSQKCWEKKFCSAIHVVRAEVGLILCEKLVNFRQSSYS